MCIQIVTNRGRLTVFVYLVFSLKKLCSVSLGSQTSDVTLKTDLSFKPDEEEKLSIVAY